MAFSDLTTELQNVLIYQHEVFLKSVYFLILFGFSFIYLFYIRPRENKTPFFSVSVMRVILLGFSVVNLITLPLLLFGFAPDYSGFDFIFIYFRIYTIALIIYVILLNIDVMRYGIPVLLKMGGLDIKDSKANIVYNRLTRGLKLGNRR